MTTRKLLIATVTFVSLSIVGVGVAAACSGDKTTPKPTADIVETASKAGTFRTLLKAAAAAGLVDTLKGDGPYTVFAPRDEAFAKLPEGTVEALLKDKEKLRSVLTYHVVPGAVTATQVKQLDHAKTVQGHKLRIRLADGRLKVDDATVVKADIVASNGVIHVIDSVMLPPAAPQK